MRYVNILFCAYTLVMYVWLLCTSNCLGTKFMAVLYLVQIQVSIDVLSPITGISHKFICFFLLRVLYVCLVNCQCLYSFKDRCDFYLICLFVVIFEFKQIFIYWSSHIQYVQMAAVFVCDKLCAFLCQDHSLWLPTLVVIWINFFKCRIRSTWNF